MMTSDAGSSVQAGCARAQATVCSASTSSHTTERERRRVRRRRERRTAHPQHPKTMVVPGGGRRGGTCSPFSGGRVRSLGRACAIEDVSQPGGLSVATRLGEGRTTRSTTTSSLLLILFARPPRVTCMIVTGGSVMSRSGRSRTCRASWVCRAAKELLEERQSTAPCEPATASRSALGCRLGGVDCGRADPRRRPASRRSGGTKPAPQAVVVPRPYRRG